MCDKVAYMLFVIVVLALVFAVVTGIRFFVIN